MATKNQGSAELINQDVLKTRKTHLAMLPSKRSLYTLTKAPMAHKTNSKEQFMFKFYFFKFSTYINLNNSLIPSSVNEATLLYFLIKKTFPAFETNLLFMKYYQLNFPYNDGTYFNFKAFVSTLSVFNK